jgi:hypothetical protein
MEACLVPSFDISVAFAGRDFIMGTFILVQVLSRVELISSATLVRAAFPIVSSVS